MTDRHAKLVRLLRIIALMKRDHVTVEQLAERFDIHIRTAYRYLEVFELAGIWVEKDFEGCYFIVPENSKIEV